MEPQTINKIKAMYLETKSHKKTMAAFSLNHSQEYAINIFGRDKHLPAALIADNWESVTSAKTIGEIAIALGFEPEVAL